MSAPMICRSQIKIKKKNRNASVSLKNYFVLGAQRYLSEPARLSVTSMVLNSSTSNVSFVVH